MPQSNQNIKNDPDYQIGQVIYILSNKSQSIIPAMIVEKIIVQTLDGRNVSWKLAIGAKDNPDKPQRIVDSNNINGDIYSSLNDIRNVLQKRLANFIENITLQAQKRTKLWYGSQLEKFGKNVQFNDEEEEIKENNDNNKKNKLNDKIDPEDLINENDFDNFNNINNIDSDINKFEEQKNKPETVQKKDLKERLKEMVISEEEVNEEIKEEEQEKKHMGFIDGPDGSRIPVRLKL